MVTGVGTQPTAADYSYQQMLASANGIHDTDLRNAGTVQAPALDELQQTLRATNADPSTGAPVDPSTTSTTASSSTSWLNDGTIDTIVGFAKNIPGVGQYAEMIGQGVKLFASLFGGDNNGGSPSNSGSNIQDVASGVGQVLSFLS